MRTADAVAPFSVGTIIAGRFVIEAPAGEGGMGVLYRALDLEARRSIALKIASARADGDGLRFDRESRTLAQLRHPRIVEYVAHGHTPWGQPFLAMEWLDGEDLAARLARGTLDLRECSVLLLAVAEALSFVHSRGLVHRDIKPGNVFLRRGRVDGATLLDFGLARPTDSTTVLTRTGAILGTPDYMAPEQARGVAETPPAADVFSLGCVLFHCLTGQPPFAGDHFAAVLAKILFEDPPRIRRIRPTTPPELEALVERMLAKETSRRPSDGAALLAEVRALGELPGDEERWSAPPTGTGALADEEQRLVSVVVASLPRTVVASSATLDSAHDHEPAARHYLPGVLAAFGARSEWLVDGTLVAALGHSDSATDQAAQAARCALSLQEHWPEADVALATGSALLRDAMPVGEAIDRAVGLLRGASSQEARPGGVLLDAVSASLLDTRFDVQPSEGPALLQSERAATDETRPLLGKPTPCVGREHELSMLETTLSTCIEEPAARAMLVTAPPGMGKSRLRHELLRRLQARRTGSEPSPEVLYGRAELASAGAPWGVIGSALRRSSGAAPGDGLETQRLRLRDRVAATVPPAEVGRVAEFLGEACALTPPDDGSPQLRAAHRDPRLMEEQVGQAFVDFLDAECSAHPVLLVLEDLQWGDALTFKLVQRALRALPDRPLMVLALARPEVSELFPRLLGERREEMRLGGLSRKASERLVVEVLGRDLSPETTRRIVDQAAGNALYLEELIRAVAGGRDDELPETVLAMLQARLSRLGPSERRVLRAASVFGETFWRGGVLSLAGAGRVPWESDESLRSLVEAEIITARRESRLPAEVEYGFRHALVREAAYSLLTEEDRARAHRVAAEYLEQAGERDPMVIAEHHRRAGERERAIPFFIRAADLALASNDLEGTLVRARRGVECEASGERLGALRGLECNACFWRNDWDECYAAGSAAQTLLAPGSLRWCRVVAHLFIVASVGGKQEHFAGLVQAFGAVTPSTEARGAYVEAASWLVTMFSMLGARDPARGFLARATELVVEMGGDPIADAWSEQAKMFYSRMLEPEPATTLELSRRSGAAFRIAGDLRNAAFADGYVGIALADLGRFTEAEATLRASQAMAERLGEPLVVANSRLYLALLLSRLPGRRDEAFDIASEMLTGNPLAGGVARGIRAHVRLGRGDLAGAVEEAAAGCEMLAMMPPLLFHCSATRVVALVALGRQAEAAALAEEGLAVLEALGGIGYNEVLFRLAAAQGRRAASDDVGARVAINAAIARIDTAAADIADPAERDVFLTGVAENAAARTLAAEWTDAP